MSITSRFLRTFVALALAVSMWMKKSRSGSALPKIPIFGWGKRKRIMHENHSSACVNLDRHGY